MMWLLGLMHIMLSLGDVDALIPIIIILILIAAAGGLTRGFDIFSLFGLGTLAGIGLGSKGSMASTSPSESIICMSPRSHIMIKNRQSAYKSMP